MRALLTNTPTPLNFTAVLRKVQQTGKLKYLYISSCELGVGWDEGYVNDLRWSVSLLFLLLLKLKQNILEGLEGQSLVLILSDFFILSKLLFKSLHKNISC